MSSFPPSLILSLASVAALAGTVVVAGCGATDRDTSTGSRDIPGVLLLENGEDGDNTSLPDDQGATFNGYWYTFDDRQECDNEMKLGSTTPLPKPDGGLDFTMSAYDATNPPAPLEGEQTENKFGVRFQGGGHSLWGAGVGVALNNQAGSLLPIDMTSLGYQGVRFMARNATGPVTLDVQITDGWAEDIHGWCVLRDEASCSTQGCFNAAFDTSVEIGTEWTPVTIPFADMMRGTWGVYTGDLMAPSGVDLSTAYQLQIKVGMVASFDIWIDNVGFYPAP